MIKKIVIISPNKQEISETFIRAHVDYLRGEIIHIYGGMNDIRDAEDLPISRFMARPSRWWNVLPVYLHYRLFNSWYNPNPVDTLSNFLKKQNISIVLAEYGTTGAAVWEACKKVEVPLIIHFHGFDASHRDILKKYLPAYQASFSYASYIIGVSQAMCKKLITLGVSADKLIYNPYGVRDSFFEIQPNYHLNTFLAVGRFVDKKAPYLTILAFQKIKEKHPEAHLIMAGTGELLNTCINLSNYLRLGIEFPGAVSHTQVQHLFGQSFCFVQHSIEAIDGDSEGTPVAILEAQAAGLPVISTLHAGIPDVVINGETGFLVEEKAVEQMAEKMLLLYQNRILAADMGARAKNHIKTNFSMDKHINKINQLITNTLAQ